MKVREIMTNLKFKGKETNGEIISAYDSCPQCPKGRTVLNGCPNEVSCRDCFNMELNDCINKG